MSKYFNNKQIKNYFGNRQIFIIFIIIISLITKKLANILVIKKYTIFLAINL